MLGLLIISRKVLPWNMQVDVKIVGLQTDLKCNLRLQCIFSIFQILLVKTSNSWSYPHMTFCKYHVVMWRWMLCLSLSRKMTTDQLIVVYNPLRTIPLIERNHRRWWRTSNVRPVIGDYDDWAGRDPFCAVTQDLISMVCSERSPSYGLIWKMPFTTLMGYWGQIQAHL